MTLDCRSVRNSNPKEAELAVNYARLSDAKNGTWCGDRPAHMSHSFLHCASMSEGKIRAVSAGAGSASQSPRRKWKALPAEPAEFLLMVCCPVEGCRHRRRHRCTFRRTEYLLSELHILGISEIRPGSRQALPLSRPADLSAQKSSSNAV